MQDLASLITEVKELNDWTDEDIAQRAKRAGHHLTAPNVSRMVRDPFRSMKPEPIIALAAGLGLPVETVVHAALVSLGIRISDPGQITLERAIRTDVGLSQQQRRSLLALLATFRDANREGADKLIGKYGLAARRGKKDD